MLALCRLAYEQGVLKGDLNDLQQLALLTSLERQDIKEAKDERRRFVMMAVAMHPERADALLRLLDEEDPDEFAKPIPEDTDFSEYVPIQQRDELADILRDLQSYGMTILEDED